jgi:hypothetical protein
MNHPLSPKRLAIVAVIATLIGLLAVVTPRLRAAEGVMITGQSVTCSSFEVTYSVFGSLPGESATITVYGPSGPLGSTTGPGSDGSHTATVPVSPPQPEGTSLYVTVTVGIPATGPAEPCYGGGGGGSSVGEPENAPAPPWEGFSDGRLNPSRDEYYSVWCHNDLIEVWRSVPESLLLGTIPVLSVFELPEGGTLDAANGLTVTRNTSDTITVSGLNGNLEPAWGSKSFSLSECIARNGGVPEPPEEPDSGGEAGSLPGDPDDRPTGVEFCFELQTAQDVIDCLSFQTGLSGLEILFLWIWQFCIVGPGIVLVPAGFYGWRWQRRGRKR